MQVSAFSLELKVGTPIGDSDVTGGAEPLEDGGIAQAWIEDLNVYPATPMLQWWRWVPEWIAVPT